MSLFIFNENNWNCNYNDFKKNYRFHSDNYNKEFYMSTVCLNSECFLNSIGLNFDDVFTNDNLDNYTRYSEGKNNCDAQMGRCRLYFRKHS